MWLTALTTLCCPCGFQWKSCKAGFGRGSHYDGGAKMAEDGALCGILLRSLLGRSGVVSRAMSGSMAVSADICNSWRKSSKNGSVCNTSPILCVHKLKYSYVVETVTMYKAEWLIGHYCCDLSLWST